MIALSYILATRNRLPFLKVTLQRLIEERCDDEEIVVVDGNSTDGAKEYLQNLFEAGKIQQFISEPNRNQAHAWNKAMLMANGAIIKKIMDDDVFDYFAIRKCKDFMLVNTGVDICISNDLQTNLLNSAKIWTTTRLPEFEHWKNGMVRSFTVSDLTMLIRKSSLSYLGLYDTQFKMMDWEYALRISYLQAKIAFYTGFNSMGVGTPGNVTSTASKRLLKTEGRIGMLKYEYAGDAADISAYSHFKIWVGTTYHQLKAKKRGAANTDTIPDGPQLQQIYQAYYKKLAEYNQGNDFRFIY